MAEKSRRSSVETQDSQFTPQCQSIPGWCYVPLWNLCGVTAPQRGATKQGLQVVREAISVLTACTCFISQPAVDKGEATEI